MQVTPQLSPETIKQILTELDREHRVISVLPGGGFLNLEYELPFLLIYRKKSKNSDVGTQRLIKSGASYLIIGNEEFENYQKLLYALADTLSAKFNSYLLLEIYSGPADSEKFIIKAPANKLPTTLEIFSSEISKITSPRFGMLLETEIKQTKIRQAEGELGLLDIERIKNLGGLLIGIEVPPVYRSPEGKLFPVFFRQFRNLFSKAINKAVFDFIRVQTSSGIASYNALGKRKVHEEVFKIDKQLTEIESSYQFLLLVAPVNIQAIKKEFFESNFENLLDYHYRLLPIDPDLLKRKLYDLRIDEIDDPALSYLFSEKREELDQQITMLNERGTKNFLYSSIRLYKGVENTLKAEAREILEKVPEQIAENEDDLMDALEFSTLARKEFEYFKSQDPEFKSKVHIRNDVNILMVSRGELYIPADYKMGRTEAKALIQHEIGTHVLTFYNGKQQPLSQLSVGLADYDPLQEGIAVLAEYLVGGLTANRLRILAGRVIAGASLLEGANFKGIFNMLYWEYGFSKERAFNITSRMLQGGGFLKDIIYLKGLVELKKYLENDGELEALLAGKFALKHLDVINELTQRNILKNPVLKPRYLDLESFNLRINKIRKGLPLTQMINQ